MNILKPAYASDFWCLFLRWLNQEDPLINNTKWTRTEDKQLLLLVNEKEMSNWIDIAVSLGTNRTPFQCLARFQRSLNAQMVKREWEDEEDAHLTAAVRAFGESNWEKVASVLDRRTGAQCHNRSASILTVSLDFQFKCQKRELISQIQIFHIP